LQAYPIGDDIHVYPSQVALSNYPSVFHDDPSANDHIRHIGDVVLVHYDYVGHFAQFNKPFVCGQTGDYAGRRARRKPNSLWQSDSFSMAF